MTYPLPDWLYDVLKWLGLIALPAFAVFYGTIGPKWGLPAVENVVLTLNALGVLIGTLIGVSHLSATPREQ